MADIGDIGGGFRLDARKWGRCVDASPPEDIMSWYEMFKKTWIQDAKRVMDRVSAELPSGSYERDAYGMNYRLSDRDKAVGAYMKKYAPMFEFVGAGANRTVFATKGGYCLKLALPDRSDAIRNEARNLERHGELGCFFKMYGFDENENLSMLCETCGCFGDEGAADTKFGQMFGLQFQDFVWTLLWQVNPHPADIEDYVRKPSSAAFSAFEKAFTASQEPKYVALRDLVGVWKRQKPEYMYDLLQFDMLNCLNWGVVRRGNDDVMIMTDVEGILKESMP